MSTSQNSKGKKDEGVPKKVRQQLAIDIESAGGIQDFDKDKTQALCKLLNNPKHRALYGNKGDPIRRQIRNLVYVQWKRFPRDKYFENVLIPFVLQREEVGEGEAHFSDADEDNTEEEDEEEITPPTPKKTTRKEPVGRTKIEPVSATKPEPIRSKSNKMNRLGDQILVVLPKGLFLVAVWVECNLDNIEFIISEDGFSVIKRTKKPNPSNASDLLSHYSWARDSDNVVVSTLDDKLNEIKKNDAVEWKESELITLPKEVIRVFVDNRGRPLGDKEASVGHHTDTDGRKIVTFFLKTVDAHRTTPSKAKFSSSGPSGMTVEEDDLSSSMYEETVEEVKAEMEDRFNDMARNMADQISKLQAQNLEMQKRMFEQMQQQQAQQAQQQQMMMAMMQAQAQSFAGQKFSEPPVPDGAPSNGHQPMEGGAPSPSHQAFAQAQAEADAAAAIAREAAAAARAQAQQQY